MRTYFLFIATASAEFYDVISPLAVPPEGGCKPWTELPEWAKNFRDQANIAKAGSYCIQAGNAKEVERKGLAFKNSHANGPYCIGKVSGVIEYCTHADGVPEQINVQIASPTEVVVNFVTFESTAPTKPPIVRLGSEKIEGVTHLHKTHAGREVYMHFIELTGLKEKGRYHYTVQSGGENATESAEYLLRAPYGSGETRIALYGDMGVYSYNNMQNLEKDCVTDESMDLIVHAGDHCYNEGDSDEARADGYMQAFEATLAHVPWMPIVGNHEFYADAQLRRYLDQTWEKWGPLKEATAKSGWAKHIAAEGESNAQSHIGALLGTGTHHAAGLHGTVPSNTSRYFSVNFGLVHLIGLSLNGYNGVDTCTTTCNKQQLEWLEADLKSIDRSKTPWVLAMSHYPLYLAEKEGVDTSYDHGPLATKQWLNAEECEYCGHCLNCSVPGYTINAPDAINTTLKDARGDLEPLFYKYGVDVYWAGHIHFYQTFHGPLKDGKLIGNGTHNPNGVIHVCSGNGGPPSPTACSSHPASKTCISQPYSYTQLVAHNATDLTWRQISNKDNSVVDEWVIHQDHHGPF